MNKFNKLYNLILLSIISLNKAYRKQVLDKSNLSEKRKELIADYLDILDNKTADFLVRYFADGTLTNALDRRVQMVKAAIKINPSIDTQGWKGSLDLFVLKYELDVLKKLQKQAAKTILFLDSFPEFSLKRLYKNGVVTYKVLNSKDGQEAVRKIIDLQWGEDANPWCLASRSGHGLDANYRDYWASTYNAYPKAIAFQNGKLLAFSANGNDELVWWDRNDKSTTTLKLLDGKKIKTKPYKFKDIFEKYNDLRFNRDSGRYDCKKSIRIKDEDLIDGHFPIPFGVIKGDFDCACCDSLTSLENGPTEVKFGFFINGALKLPSLEGSPKKIGLTYHCNGCNSLKNLKGITQQLKGIECEECHGLLSLEGCPELIPGSFRCKKSISLKTLQGAPKKIGIDFSCAECFSLTTLLGGPEYVGRTFECDRCTSLTSLRGAPKIVRDLFYCGYNPKLISLEGAPEECCSFSCYDCPSLLSLKGGPKIVKGRYSCAKCTSLKNLEGVPERVYLFNCNWCTNLLSFKGAKNMYIESGGFNFLKCNKITTWDDAPININGSINTNDNLYWHEHDDYVKKVTGNELL